MCTQFTPTRNDRWVHEHLGAHLPGQSYPPETFPGYAAPVALLTPQGQLTYSLARFGLVPHWARDIQAAIQIGRKTYNARSETVAEKPSFRDAWRKARHCIIPAQAIYEPDWRSGKSVPTRITRADGQALGIAGLWDAWRSPQGNWVHSYTMLTINADGHPFMNRFHKPGDEKRMVVVLPEDQYGAWLQASADDARRFIQAYPAEGFSASAAV